MPVRFADLPPHLQKLIRQENPWMGGQAAKKPSTYRSRTCVDRDGVMYDSEWERDLVPQLDALVAAGQLARWTWGPRFRLQQDTAQPNTLITYRPDYRLWPGPHGFAIDGLVLVEWFVLDAKGGQSTPVFKNKARQWKLTYPHQQHPIVLARRGQPWQLA
jgi:hypothetical protein